MGEWKATAKRVAVKVWNSQIIVRVYEGHMHVASKNGGIDERKAISMTACMTQTTVHNTL
jgi:hypothetical protein